MSKVLSTYMSKDIEPVFKKCSEECGSKKPSDVLRYALKKAATPKEQSVKDFTEELQLKDTKDLRKMLRNMGIDKKNTRSGGLWHERNYRLLLQDLHMQHPPIDEAIFLLQIERKKQLIIEELVTKGAVVSVGDIMND